MSIHTFDAQVAAQYGITEAVLIKNFQFWIVQNKRNKYNLKDGRTWTFNSAKAMAESFPYLTPKQIYGAVTRLEQKGVLLKGNYNAHPYDRTVWYAFKDEDFWLSPPEKIQVPVRENGDFQKVEPIPDGSTNVKPDENTTPPTPAGGEVWDDARARAAAVGEPAPRASEYDGVVWPWETETFWDAWVGWREYKHKQHKFVFKLRSSEQAALNHLQELSGDSEAVAQAIMRQSMANGWKGFFHLKTDDHNATHRQPAGGGNGAQHGTDRVDAIRNWGARFGTGTD